MARLPRQKQKLLYIQKILLEKTDEEHGLTVNEIISELNSYGINAERKSIYGDLRLLEAYGLDICSEKSKTVRYYIGERDFQISELKLLVDAIQSSKFITEKKSLELIKKVEGLASENEARLLQNQVVISNRVKTSNEKIYYSVDRLHDAISKNRAVEFYYNRWVLDPGSVEKVKLQRRRNGALYKVSPWALCWDDENYYLVAYDENSKQIRHYRVDKMEQINVTERKREGRELFEKLNMADYAKSTFSMFAGEPTSVDLSVKNDFIGIIADRFGKDVFIINDEKHAGRFIVKVNVNLSEQFFGWLFALGDGACIVAPEEARVKFLNHLEKVAAQYEEVRE